MVAPRAVVVMLAMGMLAPLAHVGALPADHVLITAVYYDTYVTNEGDEFVRIANPTGAALDLSGWKLTDGEGTITFPGGANLAAGATIFVTAKATDFRLDMIVSPQWEFLADTDPAVPQLAKTGTFSLANTGDEVRLLDGSGAVVDAVAWGNSNGTAGWSGAVLADVSEGVILERDTDELTGAQPDTDSAADWDDARMYVVGQTHIAPASFTASGATMYSSPDSTYEAIVDFLDGAESTLDLELYELTSAQLGQAIAARATAGVQVRVLMEGGPAGILQEERHQENKLLQTIEEAGGEVRFVITNASQGIHDRYDFMHGKFGIADGQRVLAMSGNWKATGAPADPTYGNREWGIVVDSPDLASYIGDVFAGDWDDVHRDVLGFGEGSDWRYLPPPPDFVLNETIPTGPYAPYFPSQRVEASFTVTPVLSPDTSLLRESGLRKLIREAQSEVLIEQMYAHKHWGPTQTGSPEQNPNLYLEEAIAAARNGASVYVLLGEEFIDLNDTRNNIATVDYLRGIAEAENITLRAKVVNSAIAEILKVHNKGIVVDRQVAVVSSINWGRNSAQENRELALLAEQPDIAEFYRDIFWYDWSPKEFKPITDLVVLNVTVKPATIAVPPPAPWLLPLPPPALPALPTLLELDHPQAHVLEVTIANVGRYGAGDFDVNVTASPTFLGANETFGQRVNAIKAGQTLVLEFAWDTLLHLGEFDLSATVDTHGEVRETNEANNDLDGAASIVLPAPGIALDVALPEAPA